MTCIRNYTEIIYACLELYRNVITGNLLQNFNDQYGNKLYTTNKRCYILKAGENLAMKNEGRRLN